MVKARIWAYLRVLVPLGMLSGAALGFVLGWPAAGAFLVGLGIAAINHLGWLWLVPRWTESAEDGPGSGGPLMYLGLFVLKLGLTGAGLYGAVVVLAMNGLGLVLGIGVAIIALVVGLQAGGGFSQPLNRGSDP
jgi:hypothetical protein